jgi:hypothetical protein
LGILDVGADILHSMIRVLEYRLILNKQPLMRIIDETIRLWVRDYGGRSQACVNSGNLYPTKLHAGSVSDYGGYFVGV